MHLVEQELLYNKEKLECNLRINQDKQGNQVTHTIRNNNERYNSYEAHCYEVILR